MLSLPKVRSTKHGLRSFRYLAAKSWNCPRSQSFVPLDQPSENESSGSNHFEITKEITESWFWLSGSLILVPRGRAPFGQHQKSRPLATSGQVQRHSGFEWLCKHNRLRPEPIRFVRLDSEHALSDGKSVNRGLPELDLARGRDPRPLTKRIAASGNEIAVHCAVCIYGACLNWLLPELSFSDRWSRGTKFWERDCSHDRSNV